MRTTDHLPHRSLAPRRPRRLLWICLLFAAGSATCGTHLAAQSETLYPNDAHRAADSWIVSSSTGATKYLGEFTDHSVALAVQAALLRSVSPYCDAGVAVSAGALSYLRRARRNDATAFSYQFGSSEPVRRGTRFEAIEAVADLSLFPSHYMNVRFTGGAGITLFHPEDYRAGTPRFDETPDLAAPHLSAAMSVDTWISRALAVTVSFRGVFFLTDRIDAFPSEELSEQYLASHGLPVVSASRLYNDSYLAILVGVRFPLPAGGSEEREDRHP